MKGKMCDNKLLCLFLVILLLIVLWYVIYGRKRVESFSSFGDPVKNANNASDFEPVKTISNTTIYNRPTPVTDSPGPVNDYNYDYDVEVVGEPVKRTNRRN